MSEVVEIIEKYCYRKDGKLNNYIGRVSWWEKRDLRQYYDEILEETAFLPSDSGWNRRIWHVINRTKSNPTCKNSGCNVVVDWVDNRRYPDYCSSACVANSSEVRNKAKSTCVERYGKDNYFKTDEFQDKTREYNLTHHRVAHSSQRSEVKDAARATSLKKYGVDNPSKSNKVKAKSAATCVERYSGISPMCDKEVKNRAKETCIKIYGTEHPMQNKDVKRKCMETNLKNHGLAYSFCDPSIRKSAIDSIYKKYGTNTPYASPEIQKKIKDGYYSKYGKHPKQSHISDESIEILRSRSEMEELASTLTSNEIADLLQVSHNTIVVYLRNHGLTAVLNSSTFEKQIVKIVESLTETVTNSRAIISPLELDIYMPDVNLAIECNGSYWHTELRGKDRHYHLNKTKLCEEKGIQLIHIWEHDWIKNPELIKRRLLSKLGKNEKVFARKTQVAKLTTQTSAEFLNQHHIQGTCPASVKYGLYEGEELLAVMTLGRSRFSKNYEWELLRYCSTKQVIGGASKLFKHFQREHQPKSVVSYSDKMWNTGNLYKQLGFKHSHVSEPSYYYTKNCIDFENRVAYQKHKLDKKLEHFDSNKTEWENMQANGFDRIWDCGSDVWVFN